MPSSRREFAGWLLRGGIVAWLGSVLYPVFRYLKPPKTPEPTVNAVNAGPLAELPPNSGRVIRFGRRPVIVVRTPSGDVRAFSAVCTHLECIVQYRPDLKHIWCACHNGHYDLHGKNIAGPPPRPLPPYDAVVADEDILVSRLA